LEAQSKPAATEFGAHGIEGIGAGASTFVVPSLSALRDGSEISRKIEQKER
jgi:hypothetical protein